MLPSLAKVEKKIFLQGKEKKATITDWKWNLVIFPWKKKLLPSSLSIYFWEISSPTELEIKEILKLRWFEIWEYA